MSQVSEVVLRLLPSSDNIQLQQFLDNVADVGNVSLVDQAVNTLLQGFPCQPLVCETTIQERK